MPNKYFYISWIIQRFNNTTNWMNNKEPIANHIKPKAEIPKKKQVNISLKRRIVFYPNHKYFKMHIANCSQHLSSRSEMTRDIIKKHYDSMSLNEQNDLLKYYESMTTEQIANTKNIDNLR